MKYIRDETGRFRVRPYYTADELDVECERIVTAFLQDRGEELRIPISTDVLTKLIERDAADLDLYADLSAEGADVQGITEFIPGQKPQVRIAEELSQDRYEHRLRTTLTHEYGHVRFHDGHWESQAMMPTLFPEMGVSEALKCKREGMYRTLKSDWMEWQAGYICGAMLMPKSFIKQCVAEYVRLHDLYCPFSVRSEYAIRLKAEVATQFNVSQDAANVRLIQLGYLTVAPIGATLFE